MARPLRIEFDGALYRATSRGNERKAIFKDDTDRKLFLDTLACVNNRFHWICHAYCFTGPGVKSFTFDIRVYAGNVGEQWLDR